MGKMSIVYKNFKDKIKIIEIHIFFNKLFSLFAR